MYKVLINKFTSEEILISRLTRIRIVYICKDNNVE